MSLTGPPQPTPTPTAQRKGLSAGAIVLIIVGALLATCVGGASLFMMSDAGKAMREVVESAANADNAPGTAELRALGCESAAVVDMSALADLAGDDEELAQELDTGELLMVVCESASIECSQVAETYIASQRPERVFTAIVTTTRGATRCQTLVSPEGQLLETLAE